MINNLIASINDVFYSVLSTVGIKLSPTVAIDAPGNVKAFLMLIRRCEGTSGVNGYRMLFGGSLFTSYADHPRKVITKSGYSSSAAGAYQFLSKTWDIVKAQEGFKGFTPPEQDKGAINRIKMRGAYDDVVNGRVDQAIAKCNKEWASLPGSPYGQPTRTLTECRSFFKQYGGIAV